MIPNHLPRDYVLLFSPIDMGCKACWGSVGYSRRNHKASHIASPFGSFQHSPAGRVIWQDGDGAIVAFETTGESRRPGCRVRDETRCAPCSGRTDLMRVKDEHVVGRKSSLVLSKASCQREAGRTHPVGHHEYQVPFTTRLSAFPAAGPSLRCALCMLIHHGDNDDCCRRDKCPCEDSNLPPICPAMFAIRRPSSAYQ